MKENGAVLRYVDIFIIQQILQLFNHFPFLGAPKSPDTLFLGCLECLDTLLGPYKYNHALF